MGFHTHLALPSSRGSVLGHTMVPFHEGASSTPNCLPDGVVEFVTQHCTLDQTAYTPLEEPYGHVPVMNYRIPVFGALCEYLQHLGCGKDAETHRWQGLRLTFPRPWVPQYMTDKTTGKTNRVRPPHL